MTLKIGSIFLRIEADYKEIEGVQTVFKKIKEITDNKITLPNSTPDYLGILRLEIEKYIRENEKFIRDEAKGNFKCSSCDKRFSSCQFLAKHIIVKHA